MADQEENYEVEKILDKKKIVDDQDNAQNLYFIKWKGFDASWNTWEPLSCLDNCQEMLRTFEAEWERKQPKKAQLPVYVSEEESDSSDEQEPIPFSGLNRRLDFSNLSDEEDAPKKKQLKLIQKRPVTRTPDKELKKPKEKIQSRSEKPSKKNLIEPSRSSKRTSSKNSINGTVIESSGSETDEDTGRQSIASTSSRGRRSRGRPRKESRTERTTNKENEPDEKEEDENFWDEIIVRSKAALDVYGQISSIYGMRTMDNLSNMIIFAHLSKSKDPVPVVYSVIREHYPQPLIAYYEKIAKLIQPDIF